MIFLLFLVSVATIEVILRRDKIGSRKLGRQAPTADSQARDIGPAADTGPAADSILALMNALERHGRGKAPVASAELEAETNIPLAVLKKPLA